MPILCITLGLISAKCIPCLLNASETLPSNSLQLKSLAFPPKCSLFKMFKLVLFVLLANAKNSLISLMVHN